MHASVLAGMAEQDWEQIPPAVQAYLRTVRHALGQLHDRVATLETRLKQHSTTSCQQPSAAAPLRTLAAYDVNNAA